MIYYIATAIMAIASLGWGFLASQQASSSQFGATVAFPTVGGTGTSTLPVAGDLLMSWGGSVYGPTGLIAGSNITISTSTYKQVTISSTGGGGGGSGNVSTSSVPVVGQIPYWTTTTATPALLSTVATGTLTAGDGLTADASRFVIGGAVDFDCDTASGSVFGCLLAADWTTFNSKESALTFSSPLIRNSNTINWSGLTTSTALVGGQVLYATNASSVSSVATSSLTLNAPITSAGTAGYVVGGSGWTLDVDDIAAVDLASADFGDWTCNGTTCSLDADTVADSEIDYAAVTLIDFTNDADFVKWANATSTLWKSTGFLSSASSTVVGDFTTTAQNISAVGSAAAPTYSFINNSDMGMYRGATNVLSLASAGNAIVHLYSDHLESGSGSIGGFYLPRVAGTVSAPTYSFDSETNTGMYRVSSNILGFSIGASEKLRLQASGASTTVLSLFDRLYVGDTATTTILGSATSTFNNGLRLDSGALQVDNLVSCDSLDTDSGGFLTCGSDATGSGGGDDPFTHTSVYGQTTSATSTLLALTASPFSLVASSTVNFVQASTTHQTVFTNLYLPNIATFQLLQTDANKIVSATTSIGWNLITGGPAGANPTANVGLTAVNGTALTFMRSDGAPALDQAIAPTWTGAHAFNNSASTTFAKGLYASTIGAQYLLATSSTATSTFTGGLNTNIKSCSQALETDSGGGIICGTDATGSGTVDDPFTHTSVYGQTTSATSTLLSLTGSPFSLVASSTVNFTQASTTILTNTGNTYLTPLTSAAIITNAGGLLAEYTGATCTNQFVRSLSVLIAATCAAVDLANDVTGLLGAANGGTGIDTSASTGVAVINSGTWSASSTLSVLRGGTSSTTLSATLLAGNGVGPIDSYDGTSCTNQFVRSLNGAGVATCATVSLTADVTGTLPIANGGTNATTFTSGKPIAFDGTSLISTSTLAVNVGGTGSTTLSATILVGAGTGVIDSYDGTSCTNQFVRSLNGAGVATCETVGTSDVAAGITLDTEWDTEGEVQTAWGSVNILLETEIDASSELAALMDDETGSGLLVFNSAPAFVGGTTTFAGGLYANAIAAQYFMGTSTATSTFKGGIKINGGGLSVDTLTSADCDVKASTAGIFSCGSDAQGSGAWPFTTSDVNFGVGPPLQSTTTVMWFKDSPFSLFASSTAVFVNATTSQLTISDRIYLAGSAITDFVADATIDLVSNALRVVDLICTNCIGATEIADLDVASGGTGASTLTGILEGNGTSAVTANDSSTVGQILRVTGASTFSFGALDLDDTDAFTGTLPVANTQLTAGRSLTLSTDDVAADAELFTDSWTFNYASSTYATSTQPILVKLVPQAATISTITCWSQEEEGATSTIMFEERTSHRSSGTDVLYNLGIIAGSGVATASSTLANSTLAAGSYLAMMAEGYLLGTPTNPVCDVKYTWDD